MKLKSILNENVKINAYIAAVLTEESREELLKQVPPTHPKVVAHHLTVSFNPTQFDFDLTYASHVEKEVTLTVTGVANDAKAQAVSVDGIPSENKHPHITLSLEQGVPAKYSNELMASVKVTPLNFQLKARIEVVPLKV